MKKIFTVCLSLAITVFISSCEDESTPNYSISATAENTNFTSSGGSTNISVFSQTDWSVIIPNTSAWITTSSSSGDGNETITLTATENNSIETRSSNIIFSTAGERDTVIITQSGMPATILATTTDTDIQSSGGTANVSITSEASWEINIPDDVTWISSSVTTGEGDTDVILTIEENSSNESRSVDIIFSTATNKDTVTITQVGAPTNSITASASATTISNSGGVSIVTITSSDSWSVSIPSTATWVSTPTDTGSGDGTVFLNFTPNSGTTAREVEVVFATSTSQVTITITQSAATTN